MKNTRTALAITACSALLLGATASSALASSPGTSTAHSPKSATVSAANSTAAASTQATSTAASSAAAVIASGEGSHQVDALAAAPLASALHTSVLLTPASDVPSAVLQHLYDRHVSTVYVIGGDGAVSQNAVDEIVAEFGHVNPVTIKRIAGSDRYNTALQVTQTVEALNN